MRADPRESADVEDGVRREVVELDAVCIHQPPDEFVNRESESPVHEIDGGNSQTSPSTPSTIVERG